MKAKNVIIMLAVSVVVLLIINAYVNARSDRDLLSDSDSYVAVDSVGNEVMEDIPLPESTSEEPAAEAIEAEDEAIEQDNQYGKLLIEGNYTDPGQYNCGIKPAWTVPPVSFSLAMYENAIVRTFSDGSNTMFELMSVDAKGYRIYSRDAGNTTYRVEYSKENGRFYSNIFSNGQSYWCEIIPTELASAQVPNMTMTPNNNNVSSINQSGTSVNYNRIKCSTCAGTGSCTNPSSPYNSKLYCHGSGRCPMCGGDGYMENRYDPLHNIRCSSCHGNGRCQTCLGTGQCKRCGGSGYIN